ncbi:hypothetical protein OM280_15795, partial [Escherichia albertii]|nr:hypothetical protein [Escherichia albertii]
GGGVCILRMQVDRFKALLDKRKYIPQKKSCGVMTSVEIFWSFFMRKLQLIRWFFHVRKILNVS